MRNIHKILIFLLFLVIIPVVILASSQDAVKLSNSVNYLGNPLNGDGKIGTALNVWDLQVFNGKVYVAGGSTQENTGPVNIWAYNPQTKSFAKEYTVDEEAIEHYKVFDNELYIPAADPRSKNINKFYRRGLNNQWTKYSSDNIKLAHVRDLIKTDLGDILLVGSNANPSKSSIAITEDEGENFRKAGIDKNQLVFRQADGTKFILVDLNTFLSVFSYQNKIYAPSSLLRDHENSSGKIAVYNFQSKKFELDKNLTNDEFIPKQNIEVDGGKQGIDIIYRIWNSIEFKNSLVYVVRSHSFSSSKYQKEHMKSLGIYIKPGLGITPITATFPDRNSLGEDILIIDRELYVLTNTKISDSRFITYIYKADERKFPNAWEEVLHFESSNLARSFEYLNNSFYFGLGHNYGTQVNQSGQILSYLVK
ncbi:MAG: hypothetical protein ACRC1Z_05320 [Waterburya sp.]